MKRLLQLVSLLFMMGVLLVQFLTPHLGLQLIGTALLIGITACFASSAVGLYSVQGFAEGFKSSLLYSFGMSSFFYLIGYAVAALEPILLP
ncbi:MAG: hypothetical protein EP332_11065 [Bacteroidetes bacterium]|nr:MAG: hypothetical protein EP332_11065 [Bacteroidota bacterium]